MKARPKQFRAGNTIVAVVLTLAFALEATPAFAVHDEGIFQLDGDAKAATCSGNGPGISSFGDSIGCNGEDWDTLYTCTGGGSLGSTCTVALPCDANGDGVLSGTECTTNHASAIAVLAVDPAPLSIFTGGGSKDEKDITQWQWVDGSVPDKDDLIEGFAALYVAPPGTTRGGVSVAGHKIVYFGANRLAVNGDAQIGFWFLQNPVGLGGTGQHASPFVDTSVGGAVSHKLGDVLILSNFVQGGGSSNIQVYVVNKLTKGNYPVVGFFEGGLDLTAVGLGGECFPTTVVETRSSQSITAVLKDFTLTQFERCQAKIATEIRDAADNDITTTSVTPGTVIHDVAFVTGNQGGPDPGQGGSGSCTVSRPCTVTFRRFANDACSGTPTTETQPCVSDGAGTGSCTATSSTFTTVQPPGYSYLATYNGDSNYPLIALPPTSCEVVEVGKVNSTIVTDIFKVSSVGPPPVLDGAFTDNHIDLAGAGTVSVVDQATVTPEAPQTCGSTGLPPCPTGTVTFTQFTNGACSGTGTAENKSLDSSGEALSSVFNLGANGLSYIATYGGDNVYNPATASRCEPVCAIDTTK